jgi:hypothetical protein
MDLYRGGARAHAAPSYIDSYLATRKLESLVPICWNVATI